jgi:hypothetical protein
MHLEHVGFEITVNSKQLPGTADWEDILKNSVLCHVLYKATD